MKQQLRILLIIAVMAIMPAAYAEEVIELPEDYIARAFNGVPPKHKVVWFTKSIRPTIDKIMQQRYPVLKTRYWREGSRTVWVLEEIGKNKPITTGVIIDEGAIEDVKVLIYRESHGWEVKHDFFTKQFDEVRLNNNMKLTSYIDNISGATMSVDALRNIARLALFLHSHVVKDE